MDQPTITIVNATEDFLKSQISALQESLKSKDEHIQRVTQRSYADSADRNRMVEGMKEWTLEQLDEDSITESQAEEIAEIMGFELSKEFEVEVTVLYSVTVNARSEEEAQNAIHDIDFDTVDYNSDSISYLSSSIDRLDIQQGATNGPEHVLKLLFLFSSKFWGAPCDQDHIVIYDTFKKCPNYPMSNQMDLHLSACPVILEITTTRKGKITHGT